MINVKSREKTVYRLGGKWKARVYWYGVKRLAGDLHMASSTLFNKLTGHNVIYDDEVKRIDKIIDRCFKQEKDSQPA
jgi:hypothetical protein